MMPLLISEKEENIFRQVRLIDSVAVGVRRSSSSRRR